MTDDTSPAPGWYPDPTSAGRQRYWDGNAWTDFTDENYAEKTGTAPQQPTIGSSAWPSTPSAATRTAPGAPGAPAAWATPPKRTSGLAIGSLVTGILSIVTCFLAGGVLGGPIAIVLSVRANRAIKQDASQTGSGLATAGLVTGIIGLLLGVVALVWWVAILNDPVFWDEFNRELDRELNR